jgi:hypothetical protein
MGVLAQMRRARGCLLVAGVSVVMAEPALAQSTAWVSPEGNGVHIWAERPQARTDPNWSPDYPSDAWFEGALTVGAQIGLAGGFQAVGGLPVAFLRGHTNGCVDAYCETPISSAVVGNPLLGIRYAAVPHHLWLQAGYRFSLMDLDPWEAGINTWQRRVDGYAAAAALAAADVSHRDAVMPHTSSVALDVVGETEIGEGLQLQARTGVIRVEQDSSSSYGRRYGHSTAVEWRYELVLDRQLGDGSFAAGVVGRRELRWSPDWDCSQLGGHCRGPVEIEISGTYPIGRFSPALQWRLPITGARRNSVKWVLGAGLRVAWS